MFGCRVVPSLRADAWVLKFIVVYVEIKTFVFISTNTTQASKRSIGMTAILCFLCSKIPRHLFYKTNIPVPAPAVDRASKNKYRVFSPDRDGDKYYLR